MVRFRRDAAALEASAFVRSAFNTLMGFVRKSLQIPTALSTPPMELVALGCGPAAPSFASDGQGLQARIGSRPRFASSHMTLPFMPRYLTPPITPRTVAHPTAAVLGGGVRFGGASHR